MDHLDFPKEEVWNKRRLWFEATEEQARGDGNYIVSEQACALMAEVQAVFCAGAWVGTLILAMSVVDAQLRETEVIAFKGNTKRLVDVAGADPMLHGLRQRRNALVHLDELNPAITVDAQWSKRSELELEAKEAVKLMFEAFYLSPWT